MFKIKLLKRFWTAIRCQGLDSCVDEFIRYIAFAILHWLPSLHIAMTNDSYSEFDNANKISEVCALSWGNVWMMAYSPIMYCNDGDEGSCLNARDTLDIIWLTCIYDAFMGLALYNDHNEMATYAHKRSPKGNTPDSKVQGANMRPTWVLSAPDGPHVGPWILLSGTVS